MTRSTPPKQVGAAEKKSPAAAGPEPPSMTFRIDEDNGGRYHWAIVAAGGEMLVRSARFASYEEAKQAAGIVHRGAARAVFADRPGDQSPIDLSAHRGAASDEDSDAERWLEEGGSFSSQAATR